MGREDRVAVQVVLENTRIFAGLPDIQLGMGRKWTLGLKWATLV
jgi:hypothetical protein